LRKKSTKLVGTTKLSIKDLTNDLKDYLSGPTLESVSCQIRVGKVKNKGQRSTAHDKAIALSLYHSSPKTCRLL